MLCCVSQCIGIIGYVVSMCVAMFRYVFKVSLYFRGVEGGTSFLLRQGEVSLLCEVVPLPHYNITETVHSPALDKFIISRDPVV